MADTFIVTVPGPDGYRTIGSSQFTENQRAAILHMVANAGRSLYEMSITTEQHRKLVKALPAEPIQPTMTQGEMATAQGYLGDPCDNCGGWRMKRAGHCTVCDDCGTATGCG